MVKRVFLLALAGTCLVALGLALADVRITTNYPSPYGKYTSVRAANSLRTGRASPNYLHSNVTLQGNAAIDGGNVLAREELVAGNGVLRVVAANTAYWPPVCMHWTEIGFGSGFIPTLDLMVNGPILARRFFFAGSAADAPTTWAAAVGVSDPVVDGGAWGEAVNKYNGGNIWGPIWTHLASFGNPYILLNRYSQGRVGIGTANPLCIGSLAPCALVIGDPGADVIAVANNWNVFSSRLYKRDIAVVEPAEYKGFLDKLSALDVVRFHTLKEPHEAPLHLGVIAEDAPEEITGSRGGGTSVDLARTTGYLLGVAKGLLAEHQQLVKDVEAMEQELAQADAAGGSR